jgi:hypothetical protein
VFGGVGIPMNESLDRDGYVLLPAIFKAAEVDATRAGCAQALAAASDSVLANGGPAYGARNLLTLWPDSLTLARAPNLAAGLRDVLGPTAGLVRGLYFDKPPGHSWALPWHRDLTIAVKTHRSFGLFRKPTTTAGVPHVEAPADLLARMLTIRIHLDAMTVNNGPLRVVPGSHAPGLPAGRPAVALHCAAGDVLFMRPLLLHASGHSAANAGHRRIVHFECAPSPELPDGYEWHTYQSLAEGRMGSRSWIPPAGG